MPIAINFLGRLAAKLALCRDVWTSSHVRAGNIATNPLDLMCQRMIYTYGNTLNFYISLGFDSNTARKAVRHDGFSLLT